MNLLIVESPNKVKKIKAMLGPGWLVAASVGHVSDLPKKEMAIDLSSGKFEMKFSISPGKQRVISNLRSQAARATDVYLAADPDREGEAIAWHVARLLKLDLKRVKRVLFSDITKPTILKALSKPRNLDFELVDAYKARRSLDRIFGYQLSPEIQKFNMASAGRCQTPCLNLVVQRERQIKSFSPQTYFTLHADYELGFSSEYAEKGEKGDFKECKIKSQEELDKVKQRLELHGEPHVLLEVASDDQIVRPLPPFETSKVLTAASSRLGFEPKRTTQLLQSLFQAGFITYIRTDSVFTSPEGVALARSVLQRDHPALLPSAPNTFKLKSSAQGAHECIRPTHEDDSKTLSGDELKLYRLIRTRFLASQSKPAIVKKTTAILRSPGGIHFIARGRQVLFKGFKAIYEPDLETEERRPMTEGNQALPELYKGEEYTATGYKWQEKQTKPPTRFKLATLTKEIETLGLGRPSTFATIVQTPLDRGYYERVRGSFLAPTALGQRCIELLEKVLPGVLKPDYTADLESHLDQISEGKTKLTEFLGNWYLAWGRDLCQAKTTFLKILETNPEAARGSGPRPGKLSSKKCPDCSEPLLEKKGRFGKYYFCDICSQNISAKKLKNLKAMEKAKKKGVFCPDCGALMLERTFKNKKSKKVQKFLGCSQYPECKKTLWNTKI